MIRYLQALGHRFFPDFISAPARQEMTQQQAEDIVNHIKKTPNTSDNRRLESVSDIAFGAAKTAIGGMMFAVFEELYEREEKLSYNDVGGLINRNQDLAIIAVACLAAEMALGFAQSQVNSKFFSAAKTAKNIKNGLRAMTPNQIEEAIDVCSQNGDLSEIKIPKQGPVTSMITANKMQISYLIGTFLAQGSGVGDDQKYLVLGAGKVVASFLIDRVERFASKYTGESGYFDREFLNSFSDDQKDEIRLAILDELRNHSGCKEDLKDALVAAAATFTFLGIVNHSPFHSLAGDTLSDKMVGRSGDFAVGSISADSVRVISGLIDEALRKNNRVGFENTAVGDQEIEILDVETPRSEFSPNSISGVNSVLSRDSSER